MKNKTIIVICFLLKVYTSSGQMKVANTTGTASNSSILEVESENRGFLPPRISLSDPKMPLNGGLPWDGMIVFNTDFSVGTDNSGVYPGLYIWHHGRWNKLQESRLTQPINYVELRQTVEQYLNFGNNLINWNMVVRSQQPVGDLPMWSNGSNITIRRAGIYCITSSISTSNYGTGYGTPPPAGHGYLFIQKNGEQLVGNGYNFLARPFYLNAAIMIYCNINDVLNIGYWSGVNDGVTIVNQPYYVKTFITLIPPFTSE
ncbi:MAG: hypothetical protein ABWZ79_18225 [Pedobacter agri]